MNIDEEVSWSNELELTCQVLSTEVDWEPISISLMPASVFQGKTQFSFEFDFSALGDPTLLSLEARMDCWADGMDDAGWDLVKFSNSNEEVPWLSVPLSSVGPNIELVDVSLDGIIEAGKEIRAEISVKNTGEDLDDSFNISAYIIENGDRELVGKYPIKDSKWSRYYKTHIFYRPRRRLGIIGNSRRRTKYLGIERGRQHLL